MASVAELYVQRQRETQRAHAQRFTLSAAQESAFPNVASNIQLVKLLGKGNFGQVWQGTRKNGKITDNVVIKIAKLQKAGSKTQDLVNVFLAEAAAQTIINKANKRNEELCKEVVSCALDMFISPDLDGIIIFPFQTPETLENFIFYKDKLNRSIGDVVAKMGFDASSVESAAVDLYRRIGLLQVVYDLIRDVKRLHEAGIAHLDLKPANILVSEMPNSGNGKNTILIDLGLACADDFHLKTFQDTMKTLQTVMIKSINAQETSRDINAMNNLYRAGDIEGSIRSSEVLKSLKCIVNRGTPIYMSPEVLSRKSKTFSASIREDLYALGVIIFEVIMQMMITQNEALMKSVSEIPKYIDQAKAVQTHISGYVAGNTAFFGNEIAAIIQEFTSSKTGSLPKISNAEKTVEKLIEANQAELDALQRK